MAASHPFAALRLRVLDDKSCPKARRVGSLGLVAKADLNKLLPFADENFRRVQWRVSVATEHGRRRSRTELGSLIYNAKGPADSHRR